MKLCLAEIPKVPGALKDISAGIRDKIYGSSMTAVFYVGNFDESKSIDSIHFNICAPTGCTEKIVDHAVAPRTKDWLRVLWTDLDVIQSNAGINYQVSCSIFYTDGSKEACPQTYSIDPLSSPLLPLPVGQASAQEPGETNPPASTGHTDRALLLQHADINGDRAINTIDYAMFLIDWKESTLSFETNLAQPSDINRDGKINAVDVSIPIDNLGKFLN